MLNIISLLLAWYPISNEKSAIESLDKCIASWKVIQVDVVNDYDDNCDIAHITAIWEEGQYELITHCIPSDNNPSSSTCMNNAFPSYYLYWFASNVPLLPKIWDNIDFLIDKNSYKVISWNKISNWEYKFSYYYNSKWNFEVCEPNTWEDTEIQARTRKIRSYLWELYYNKPKIVVALKPALEKLDLSKYNETTQILAEAMKKILDDLISGK
jgi:hypothetical protein